MTRRIAAAGPNENHQHLPDEDDDEKHWVLERMGELALALIVVSFGACVLGLATLAVNGHFWLEGLTPVGKTIVAGGTLGAMASMTLATVVATLDGTFSPF